MLARLAGAFARWTEGPAAPPCLRCRAPMALRSEQAVGELPVVVTRVYACDGCGAQLTHVHPWAIPS